MEANEIHLDDWWRMLVGEVPWFFLIEVIFRSAFVFIILITSMRLLGKRMAGQLNKSEMIGLTTLAAAIGVPIQAPDRGLIPPFIIAAIVVGIGRILASWSYFSQKAETFSQGELGILIKDSVLQMPQMRKTKVTRERLFAQLRSKGLIHLGQVNRVYFEAGGFFSMVLNEKTSAGLKIIPVWDTDYLSELKFSNEVKVCTACGKPKKDKQTDCDNCRNDKWEPACIDSAR
jgi:uncharacterized membrane protein YcaP (DUF421 family)